MRSYSLLRIAGVDAGRSQEASKESKPSALLAERAPARWLSWNRSTTLALALALFAAVFTLRIADPHAGNGEGVLFVLPISLLALSFGVRGGIAGGLLGCCLILLWARWGIGGRLTVPGFLNRYLAYLALGGLLGSFVDRRRRLEAELIRCHDTAEQRLAENARSLETMIAERTGELDAAHREMLKRLAIAAEYRDDETFQHTERVGELAACIGAELGFSAAQVRVLRAAAPLHDIGKLAISDSILLKPGELTAEEFGVIKTHTTRGAQLLSGSSSSVLQRASAIALSHHERWDGTGYPYGLAGERISLAGRIVAVADVFDVLTHEPAPKAAWTRERAVEEIRRASGTRFDPTVVEAFLRVCASRRLPQLSCAAGGQERPAGFARAEESPAEHAGLLPLRSERDLVGTAPTAP